MKRILAALSLVACGIALAAAQDYISVTGNAYLEYKPASVRIVCYVAGYGDSALEANRGYALKKGAILKALAQYDIGKDQVQQVNFRVQANQDQEGVPGKVRAEGYLEIRHALFDKGDGIIEALCRSGVGRIDTVEVKKAVDQESYRKAYADAYADAYRKAQQLVQPTKRSVGRMSNASETSSAVEDSNDTAGAGDMQFIPSRQQVVSITFSFTLND